MSSKVIKHFGHVIAWLAAEYKYLRILHQSLERIDLEDIDNAEKELKKDKRIVRYIGRAERKVDGDVQDILETLQNAERKDITGHGGSLPEELHKLFEQIEIPAHEILHDGSMYVGSLRKQLQTVRTDVEVEEKYPDKKQRAVVQREIGNVKRNLTELEKWVAALDAALKLFERYYYKYGSYLPGIHSEISLLGRATKFRLCSRIELKGILRTGKLNNREYFNFKDGLTKLLSWFRIYHFQTVWNLTGMRGITGGMDQHKALMKALGEASLSNGKPEDKFFQSFQKHALENLKKSDFSVVSIEGFNQEAREEINKVLNENEKKVFYDALADPNYLAKNRRNFRLFMMTTIKVGNITSMIGPLGTGAGDNGEYHDGYEVLLIYTNSTPDERGELLGHRKTLVCDANKYLLGIVVLIPLGNMEREVIKLVKASNVKVPVLNVRRKVIWPKK